MAYTDEQLTELARKMGKTVDELRAAFPESGKRGPKGPRKATVDRDAIITASLTPGTMQFVSGVKRDHVYQWGRRTGHKVTGANEALGVVTFAVDPAIPASRKTK